MYSDFIDEICDKYGYDADLRRAIEISFSLMMDEYDDLEGIKKIFSNVRIFNGSDITQESIDHISFLMMNGANEHVLIDDDESAYGNDNIPGAFYSYEPVFDDQMNVTGEKRWIVTKNTKGTKLGEGFSELFGTSINIPYFLHELNHAYAMQKAIYKCEDGKIYSKHGMFETVDEVKFENGKYVVKRIQQKNVINEEMVNEMLTQRMLCKFLKIDDYSEVQKKLFDFGYSGTSYSVLLITLSKFLERALGKDDLMRLRTDNDYSVIEKFNSLVLQSSIYKKYCDGVVPYDYFSGLVFEMFTLTCNRLKTDNYIEKMEMMFCDAMAVISSYDEVKNQYGDLEKYEQSRISLLREQAQIGQQISSVKK